jgi:hypothetical protein
MPCEAFCPLPCNVQAGRVAIKHAHRNTATFDETERTKVFRSMILGGHLKTGQWEAVRHKVLLPCLLRFWQARFGSAAPRAALQQLPVVKQAVDHGADRVPSPNNLPPSSMGRFEVTSVLARS